MLYATSLRAIGQSLEMLRLQTFSLEKRGEAYIVRSDSLTPTHEWILRNSLTGNLLHSVAPDPIGAETVGDGSLCYGPLDLACLNAQKQKTRSNHHFGKRPEGHMLSDLLRALGEHLDMKEASAFNISWTSEAALVDYQTPDGSYERKDFSLEKLHQLALQSKFRRSRSNGLIGSR